MPKKLLFATGNSHKVQEVNKLLQNLFTVESLKDIGFEGDIPETASTLKGNALIKAQFVYNTFSRDCFSEDTGLEIEALGGAPGVHTARYAGPLKNPSSNMALVLDQLTGSSSRAAQFRTVICLILKGQVHYFEGIAPGQITREITGDGGFGYDPIFRPAGYDHTFAQMDKQTKNAISHRGKAIRKLVLFLQQLSPEIL